MMVGCTPRHCKAYYAAYVKINTPYRLKATCYYYSVRKRVKRLSCQYLLKKGLDTAFYGGIIYLTIMPLRIGVCHGRSKECKNQGSAGARIAQLASAENDRRNLRRQRVFRLVRHCSGQVRDASSRAGGRIFSYSGGICFWVFPGGILSSTEGLRRGRIARSDTQTPRAKACPQTYRYRPEFYRSVSGRGQNVADASFGKSGSKAVWLFSSPSQYRTGVVTSTKKGAMNSNMVDRNTSCGEWASRYEELRRAVLSGHQSNNNSWGMALFIRQGFIGWMRAWPMCDAPARPKKCRSTGMADTQLLVPSSLQEQITILLANMILNGRREAPL